jgi:hypothetical protein
MNYNAPKKFSWSWSRLKNWRSCPKRHYHIDIAKDTKQPETEALLWGHQFHEAMAARINGEPLPEGMEKYEALPALLHKRKLDGIDISTELQLAMDADFQPSPWFGPTTWVRAVVDVLCLSPLTRTAVTFDWKTGKKIEPEFEQLGITAAVIFSHYPDIDEVHAVYQWSAHNKDTSSIYKRDEMTRFWAKLLPEINRWEKDAANLTYPPKPSGLCIAHCPVKHCPHHGKGSNI